MNVWTVIIILLAVALAVGPVMLMQPSNHSKRLARLRQSAAQLGLKVRMATLENDPNRTTVAVYSVLNDQVLKDSPQLTLLKLPFSHDIHFHHRWDWLTESDNKTTAAVSSGLSPEQIAHVKSWLDRLPEDFIGFEIDSKHLGLWWTEKSDTSVEQLKQWLDDLIHLLMAAKVK